MFYSYKEALDYLQGFINLEHRRLDQYAPENYSLDRPAKLLEQLGSPHLDFPSIHIAGTKGKGSVAAMCAEILRLTGLKVGLYTSPHLQDFRDRIRVVSQEDSNGRIAPDRVVHIAGDLRSATELVPGLTWYELITAMAFRYFSDEQVDIAVVEVGLGGRLDATNILTPLVSAITSLSLDHTYLLGNTLDEIATEKGGIIKPGIPVVSAPQAVEAENRLASIARSNNSPFTLIGRDWDCRLILPKSADAQIDTINGQEIIITRAPSGTFIQTGAHFSIALMGYHQVENALVALATLDKVRSHFPDLSAEKAQLGLATVEWLGRLQTLTQGNGQPTVLVDCAHNVDSAEKLVLALKENYQYQEIFLVLGVTADKDVIGIMQALLPQAHQTFITASTHPRACPPSELSRLAAEIGQMSQVSDNVADALLAAWKAADPEDLICVTGSIFVVGDLLNQWEALQSKMLANGDRFHSSNADFIFDR
jgi:dihydrofolate synthase/folylpolyglutamate synthase